MVSPPEERQVMFQIAPKVASQQPRLQMGNQTDGRVPVHYQMIDFLAFTLLIGCQ
jgi:hypothetical protein